MKLYTSIDQRNTLNMYKSMFGYAMLNFLVLILVFVLTYFTIFISGYMSISNGVEKSLQENMETMLEDGLDDFDATKYPSAMKFIGYDEKGNIISNYGNNNFDVKLSNLSGFHIVSILTKLDLQSVNTFETIKNANIKDTVKTYTVAIDGDSTHKYVMVIVPINDIIAFEESFIGLMPIYFPITMLIILLASGIIAYYQCLPNLRSIRVCNRFTSDVSHELNTPLSIMQSNLQDMLEEPNILVGDKSVQLVDSLNEVKRLQKLTSQLLTMARSDTSRLMINYEDVELLDLLHRMSEPYQMMAEMDGKTFKLKTNLTDSKVRIDKDLFVQIITALLDNAIKYTISGENICLYITIEKSNLILVVQDSGAGVKEVELSKIFNRFYRSDEARTTKGTGLGLSIVHAIVVAQGGTISASNLSPRGFEIRIKMPTGLNT